MSQSPVDAVCNLPLPFDVEWTALVHASHHNPVMKGAPAVPFDMNLPRPDAHLICQNVPRLHMRWTVSLFLHCLAQAEDPRGTARRIGSLAIALGAVSEADEEQVIRAAMARMASVAIRYVESHDEAMDCAQDALIRAVNAFDGFEGRSSVTSWLHRIAVNCALEQLRRRGRRHEVSIDDLMPTFDDTGILNEQLVVSDDSAETILQRADARAVVTRAIDALPDSHRTVLLLRDIEEMSIAEVAERLEISPGTAKVRIHRARSALRKLLEPLLAAGQL